MANLFLDAPSADKTKAATPSFAFDEKTISTISDNFAAVSTAPIFTFVQHLTFTASNAHSLIAGAVVTILAVRLNGRSFFFLYTQERERKKGEEQVKIKRSLAKHRICTMIIIF